LLKGAKLKNTEWAIGIIVYTGLDTKTMRNGDEAVNKTSNIEKIENKVVF